MRGDVSQLHLCKLSFFLGQSQVGIMPDFVQVFGQQEFGRQVLCVPVSGQAGQNRAVGIEDEELDVMRAGAISCIDGVFVWHMFARGTGIPGVLNVFVAADKIAFVYTLGWFG